MHPTTPLLPLLALLATTTTACFSSGANWGDHRPAKSELAAACKELSGFYHVRDHRRVCKNSPDDPGKSYVFEVTNESGHDATYQESVCNSNIGWRIDHCGHGGEDTQNGWHFRGDPNNGKC